MSSNPTATITVRWHDYAGDPDDVMEIPATVIPEYAYARMVEILLSVDDSPRYTVWAHRMAERTLDPGPFRSERSGDGYSVMVEIH